MPWYVLRSLYSGWLAQWTVVDGPFPSFALAKVGEKNQVAKGAGGCWRIASKATCLREGISTTASESGGDTRPCPRGE